MIEGIKGIEGEEKDHTAAGVAVGDQVRLRKPHPCGSFDWHIIRIGADIGLRCLGCSHKVLLSRAIFERRFKKYLVRAAQIHLNEP